MKEDDFLQSLSKNTRKSCKTGLRKFERYFGKSVDEILKLRDQDHVFLAALLIVGLETITGILKLKGFNRLSFNLSVKL